METKNVFRRLSKRMLEDFSISAEISHHGSKGTYRENTLKKFLSEGRLPTRYGIGTGEIVGPVHNVSRQSDLIIFDSLNGISLIYDENTQVYPIECVAGTIEVKSTLNKGEFIKSLENIKSVKKLAPRETTTKTLSGFVHITEVLQSGLTIVEYAPFSSYLPRLPQEALLCRRLWTSQPS